jgi:hypothetical protein
LEGAELLSWARRYLSEGGACARQVLEGEDAGSWRELAIENLMEAEKAVERFLQGHPDDPAAKKLRLDIAALKTACTEDMSFFE